MRQEKHYLEWDSIGGPILIACPDRSAQYEGMTSDEQARWQQANPLPMLVIVLIHGTTSWMCAIAFEGRAGWPRCLAEGKSRWVVPIPDSYPVGIDLTKLIEVSERFAREWLDAGCDMSKIAEAS